MIRRDGADAHSAKTARHKPVWPRIPLPVRGHSDSGTVEIPPMLGRWGSGLLVDQPGLAGRLDMISPALFQCFGLGAGNPRSSLAGLFDFGQFARLG